MASPSWLEGLKVRAMDDGGMGSLQLFPERIRDVERRFGRVAAEHKFADVDGVEVIATLILDQHDVAFELDIWKIDFTPLVRIPDLVES
jgi:hypothetical protein